MPNGRSPREFMKTWKPKSEFPALQTPEEVPEVEPELVQTETRSGPSTFMETYKPPTPKVDVAPAPAVAPAVAPATPPAIEAPLPAKKNDSFRVFGFKGS